MRFPRHAHIHPQDVGWVLCLFNFQFVAIIAINFANTYSLSSAFTFRESAEKGVWYGQSCIVIYIVFEFCELFFDFFCLIKFCVTEILVSLLKELEHLMVVESEG